MTVTAEIPNSPRASSFVVLPVRDRTHCFAVCAPFIIPVTHTHTLAFIPSPKVCFCSPSHLMFWPYNGSIRTFSAMFIQLFSRLKVIAFCILIRSHFRTSPYVYAVCCLSCIESTLQLSENCRWVHPQIIVACWTRWLIARRMMREKHWIGKLSCFVVVCADGGPGRVDFGCDYGRYHWYFYNLSWQPLMRNWSHQNTNPTPCLDEGTRRRNSGCCSSYTITVIIPWIIMASSIIPLW